METGTAEEKEENLNILGRGGSVGSAPKLNDDSQDGGEWTTEALEKPIEKPSQIEKL